MRNFLYILSAVLLLMISGCSKYDDSAIKSDVFDLKGRVLNLESQCLEMNSNIVSLKSIVESLQKGNKITDVKEVTNGMKFYLSNGTVITISNGKDGKNGADGTSPVISVKKHTDGFYYWTLNGDWLLDESGNKIPTTGQDGINGTNGKDGINGTNGKDGITPQLKIEDGNWYLSVDEGESWTMLGKATGEDGDKFFSSVTQDDRYVYLTLADGEEIQLPKENTFSIVFAKSELHPTTNMMEIPFQVVAGESDIKVVVFADRNIQASVELLDSASGKLIVNFLEENLNGNILVAAKSNGKTAMEILQFEKGELFSTTESEFHISSGANDISIVVSHNMDIEVSSNVEWISGNDSKSIITETLHFGVNQNNSLSSRQGSITITSLEDETKLEFLVIQEGKPITDFVRAQYSGGAIRSINDQIQYGSQLYFGVVNNSTSSITVKSVQLTDGLTGEKGNVMSINSKIAAHESQTWVITIGLAGIHKPIAEFIYLYEGEEYSTRAEYSDFRF